jgi:hypothetical protein
MDAFSFPGSYKDDAGTESIVWQVQPSTRRGPYPGFEVRAVIRGVEFWGYEFDGLEPIDHEAAAAAGFRFPEHGELDLCVLRGDLPCTVDVAGQKTAGAVCFALTLNPSVRTSTAPTNLTLTTTVRDTTYSVEDEWFEGGMQRLQDGLPADVRLICCFTCLLSDYSPLGHGLLGMRCHRDASEQYLAVTSKQEYWSVPVTEDVMETYLCSEFQPRVPGTGYRG